MPNWGKPNNAVTRGNLGRPILTERGEVMSREQKVAVVEAYLDCFATKDLSKVSFAEDVTFEGPRMSKLTGRATILGFLTQILPVVKGIQLKQHIVEGDTIVISGWSSGRRVREATTTFIVCIVEAPSRATAASNVRLPISNVSN
jgi:hypothetical protein